MAEPSARGDALPSRSDPASPESLHATTPVIPETDSPQAQAPELGAQGAGAPSPTDDAASVTRNAMAAAAAGEDVAATGGVDRAAPEPLTVLLTLVARGDGAAQERLWRMVYEELRALARARMRHERRSEGLQTTVLVHEAYLKLARGDGAAWANRRYFFKSASIAMRQILVDDARSRKRLKRGGGVKPCALDESRLPRARPAGAAPPTLFERDPGEVLDLVAAIETLEREHPLAAEVVHLRYFAGLTRKETAEVMRISPGRVGSFWRFARAWLHRALSEA